MVMPRKLLMQMGVALFKSLNSCCGMWGGNLQHLNSQECSFVVLNASARLQNTGRVLCVAGFWLDFVIFFGCGSIEV